MLLRYSPAAPTLLIMHIDWGFLIFGDSGSGFYDEAFHAFFEFEFVPFRFLDFREKSCGILLRLGWRGMREREKKGVPMGTYEEMGKGQN